MSGNGFFFKSGLLAVVLAVAPAWAQNTISVSCPATATANGTTVQAYSIKRGANTLTGLAVTCTINATWTASPSDEFSIPIQVTDTQGNGAPNVNMTLSADNSQSCNSGIATAPCGGDEGNSPLIDAVTWVGLTPAQSQGGAIAYVNFFIPSTAPGGEIYNVYLSHGFWQNSGNNGGSAGSGVFTVSSESQQGGTVNVQVPSILKISTPTPGTSAPGNALTAQATAGRPYTQTFIASGGTANYTWSVNTSSLPNGLGISTSSGAPGNGVISGTVAANTTPGTFSGINVTVKDSATPQGSANGFYSLVVNAALSNLVTPTLSGSTSGPIPTNTITVTGGTPPYAWSAPTLATYGLSLTSASTTALSNSVTNTPTATTSGAVNIPITVTDFNGSSVSGNISLTINGVLSLSPADGALPVGATQGAAYTTGSTIAASGGTLPYAFSIKQGVLPAGLNFSTSTGQISGTPTVNGPFGDLEVTVTDHLGASVLHTYTMVINPALVLTATTLGNATLPGGTSNTAYPNATNFPSGITFTASGGSGVYTWTVATGIPGVSMSPAASPSATATIGGTPTTAGTYSATIAVKDANNISATLPYPGVVIAQGVQITTPANNATLAGATVGAAYSVTVTATGGSAPYHWTSTNLPVGGLGLSNSITNTISIIGNPTTAGTPTTINLTVTDSSGSASTVNYTIAVNAAPTLGGGPLPFGTVGLAYTSSGANALTVTGGTANFTWSATGLPTGLTMNTGTGVISGTPTVTIATPTQYTAVVSVKDANNVTSPTASFQFTVDPAITITPAPGALAVAIPALAYKSITFVAAGGGGGPYTLAATGVPTGLTFTPATGVLTGTPSATAKSSNTITMTVTDSFGAIATFTYTLAVAPPLSISGPASLPAGTVGVTYPSTTIAATGGTLPYKWTASGLPSGLSIGSATGTISGAPTVVLGTPFAVTVTVTDANGTTATSAALNYKIAVAALPLTIVTGLLPQGVINAPYPFTSIRATGGVGNYTWSITGLPPGLTTDGNGDISGTPTSITGSPFSVVVTVTDVTQTSKTVTLSLTISNVLTVAVPATLPPAALNTAYAPVTVIAGGGLPPYTWTATGLPSGMSIAIATGTISGTPTTAAGTPYSVTVTVTDSRGVTANMPYTLAVNSPLSISGPAALPSGTVGAAYTSTTVTATGGSGVYTWSATGLPSGLSIAATSGAITGTPGGGTAGSASVVVTVTDSSAATATMTYSLTINPGPSIAPVISSVSASTEGQNFIAPNTWLSVYGSNFAAAGFTDNWTQSIKNSSTGALPILLDGVSVMVGGVPAYVNYISATQLNVLTANVGFGPLQVTVTTSGGTSNAVTITAQQNIPGFFEWPNPSGQTPGDSTQQPVATHADYSDAVANGTIPGTTTVPAAPGETIILWGSGFGPTTPDVPYGVGIPTTPTFDTSSPVTVSINGAPATVYQGLAFLTPGNAGLFQVGVTVPASLANGSYSITTTVGDVTSPPLTLVVHN